MLGPMEYHPITITLPVVYNRSIIHTHTYIRDQGSLYIKYNSNIFSSQFG